MNEYIYNRFANQSKRSKFFSENQTYLDFLWQPASKLSENTPTLVYFLGYDGKIPQNPNVQKEWNILWVSDCNGPSGSGIWYFGTGGDDYLLSAVKRMLNEFILSKLINATSLFFAGKGMGGHIALYLTYHLQAKGCHIHNPTTNLSDSAYAKQKHKNLFENVFGENELHDFRNLISIANESELKSDIFITHNLGVSNSFYLEHLEHIQADNVKITHSSNYNFKLILSNFTPPKSVSEGIEIDHYLSESLQYEEFVPIAVSLNSRKEFIFDKDFSFHMDPYDDRSWRFWFQNLSWLTKHLNSLDEKLRTAQCTFILSKWFEFLEDKNADDEFHYHDHSLAYRAMNLIEVFPVASSNLIELISQHVEHIGQLLLSPLEDNALSNHAFDQAVSLFLISQFLDSNPYAKSWERVALIRIERELRYSFTSDGVHVENSPSYHHGMISNIHKSINRVLKITKSGAIEEHLRILPEAVKYLSWIIRPDGRVPPIGDSEVKQVSVNLAKEISAENFSQKIEGMKVFGHGYGIWKSSSKRYHMTLKSCHHGRFHRHDDDCSMTLWVNERNLLMDSGMLYYLEKDVDRIHVRSPKGHSGFEIPKKKPNRNFFSKAARRAKVETIDSVTAKATMGMYGNLDASRQVSMVDNIVLIQDTFSKGCLSENILLNFVIDGCWNLKQQSNEFTFVNEDGTFWTMEIDGFKSDFRLFDTFTSSIRNTKQRAFRLSLEPNQSNTKITINLRGLMVLEE